MTENDYTVRGSTALIDAIGGASITLATFISMQEKKMFPNTPCL